MKKWMMLVLCCLLIAAQASADTDLSECIIANGQVAAAEWTFLTAPCSGILETFRLQTGDRVNAGDVLFSMQMQSVYAPVSGVVGTVFGAPGEYAENVQAVYGSMMTIRPSDSLWVQGTFQGGYNRAENRDIHAGMTLYLQTANTPKKEAEARVLQCDATGFLLEMLKGDSLELEDTVWVYRLASHGNEARVGTGKIIRQPDAVIPGAGYIAEVLVKAGDAVEKGTPLFRVLAGDADPGMDPAIHAPADGVVTMVAVQPGQQVWKGQMLARVDDTASLEVIAQVDEIDIRKVRVGMELPLTLDMDASNVMTGTVMSIVPVGNVRQNVAYFSVHIAMESSAAMIGASASVYLPR